MLLNFNTWGQSSALLHHFRNFTLALVSGSTTAVLFWSCHIVGAVVQLVEYRTRNQVLAGSTHTRSTATNLEQVANLLCAQAKSASYPQRDGK